MTANGPAPEQTINRNIAIDAPVARVWAALTEPAQVKQWMSPDSEIEINTNWIVGSPMIIHGPWYKTRFENKGTVLAFEPEQTLAYSHLSSLSRLPDVAENYTELRFRLTEADTKTIVDLTLTNFPTDAIYRHFAYYWTVALGLLKKFMESNAAK